MLITRCEWHRGYFGYVAYLGFKRDGRWRWQTTGGLCGACAAVLRSRPHASTAPSVGKELGRVAVALTAFAAWALVVLLAGCSTERVSIECSRRAVTVESSGFGKGIRIDPDVLTAVCGKDGAK